jgi:hypothetical protein
MEERIMKKWIALILALVLALSMTACGETESVAGKVEPQEETELVESPVTMGRLEGGTYINEYTGYGCDLDSSWTFYTAEELQELPGNVKEILAGTEIGDSINTLAQFMDVMAENVDMLTTMNVVYQKLSMQERLGYALLTDEEILDEVLKLKDSMIESFAQAGMEVESMEETTVTFLGKERPALRTVATNNGVPQYTLQVFDFRLGQYSVTLTATSFIDDNTQWVLDQFHSVD